MRLLPMLAAIAAMAAFQTGDGLAKELFPVVGPIGATAQRLALGGLLLLILVRPWRHFPRDASRTAYAALIALGVCTAIIMTCFFLAMERLPLGIVISLQFLGPLCVALFSSRRFTDVVWALLAGIGVWCLVGADAPDRPLDSVGILFALVAAVGFGSYILCGRMAAGIFGASAAPLSVCLAALLVLPAGIWQGGSALLDPAWLPLALAVAAISVALPFWLELYAMPRMPARTFAVFMSIEPMFGVLSGLFILGERLAFVQVAGVVIVVMAAAGSAWTSGEEQ